MRRLTKKVTEKKKTISIQDKQLRAFFKKGGRKGARKDFAELLRRAVNPDGSKPPVV